MKILYIDDDEDDIKLFQDAIEEINDAIECNFATTADEALLALKPEKLPDVIFLDLNMPEMNGKKLLENYKSNPLFQQVPVIMLATSGTKKEVSDCRNLGACQYIVKPCDFRQMVNELRRVIQELEKK